MQDRTPGVGTIACDLDADDAASRMDRWRALARDAQVSRERGAGVVRLAFRRDSGTEAVLTELVELERQCCPFLSLELGSSDELLTLQVSGPPEAEAVLAMFASDPEA